MHGAQNNFLKSGKCTPPIKINMKTNHIISTSSTIQNLAVQYKIFISALSFLKHSSLSLSQAHCLPQATFLASQTVYLGLQLARILHQEISSSVCRPTTTLWLLAFLLEHQGVYRMVS